LVISRFYWCVTVDDASEARDFNHGVEGSSPSALTNNINSLEIIPEIAETLVWAMCWQTDCHAPPVEVQAISLRNAAGISQRALCESGTNALPDFK
jgi:hypothetical protein